MENKRSGIYLRVVWSLALVGLLVFGAAGRASATGSIIYVKSNAAGVENGASWADAYRSLQSALGVAISGDQIWVAKGTYKPTSGTDPNITFGLKGGVAIYGGFAGTETALGQRNPVTNLTILSGDIGVVGDASDNAYNVVTGNGVSSTAILDGFKIAGGHSFGSTTYGGGILNTGSSPTLRNLTFTGNIGYGGGGMANIASSNPTLSNVTFSGNFAGGGLGIGGAMYNSSSNPTLINVTFSGNSANYGGGMYNSNSSPTLSNVTFNGNTVSFGNGGGMYNDTSNPTLINTTFSGNSATGDGNAMSNNISAPNLYDSIFWGDGTVEISNTASSPMIANSIVKGGCPSGSTCIGVLNANPVLGPLQNNGGVTQTMALGAGSGAIDKGNNSTCAAKDQRGIARPQGGKCDIGAYEVKALSFTSAAAYDGWVLESAETSNAGGSLDSTNAALRVGDDASNRQYRGLLSFDTTSLPDAAAVVLAQVRVRQLGAVTGTNPFTTHGNLLLDLRKPYFGSEMGLVLSDFQAAATVTPAGTIGSVPTGGFYTGALSSSGRLNINKVGPTQLRLRFTLDDNNDHGADYLSFYSGNATIAANRPVLTVYYNP